MLLVASLMLLDAGWTVRHDIVQPWSPGADTGALACARGVATVVVRTLPEVSVGVLAAICGAAWSRRRSTIAAGVLTGLFLLTAMWMAPVAERAWIHHSNIRWNQLRDTPVDGRWRYLIDAFDRRPEVYFGGELARAVITGDRPGGEPLDAEERDMLNLRVRALLAHFLMLVAVLIPLVVGRRPSAPWPVSAALVVVTAAFSRLGPALAAREWGFPNSLALGWCVLAASSHLAVGLAWLLVGIRPAAVPSLPSNQAD